MTDGAQLGRSMTTDGSRSLSDIRMFSGLAPRELALLAAECEWRDVSRNEIICSTAQGASPDGVIFVVRGAVRLARPVGAAGRIAYVDVAEGGQFGEMAIFGVADPDLTALAREDGTVATLSGQRFLELLAREESVSRALLCQYAGLLRRHEEMSKTPTDQANEGTGAQRVYAELLALAEPSSAEGGAGALHIARLPRHRELADRVATTEEVVARAIAELVRAGIAARDYPGLVVKDEAALRALCTAV
jgi:CRP/FNR family cyclic AMP-dependent transcriptional regulator